MSWRLVDDPEAFHTVAGPALARAPVEHTLPLTIIDQLRRGTRSRDQTALLAVHDGGAVAIRTPPRPLILTAADDLDDLVALIGPTALDAVNAREPVANAFAVACGRRRATVRMRLHLLELGTLVPPRPPDRGGVRVATAADEQIIWDLMCAMAAEIGEPEPLRAGVGDRVQAGEAWLWEVGGGPVASAGYTAPVSGVARVALVYTLPEHRRCGYAAAVTAAATESALRRAERVCLFTDAANPTSNAIYERLGYHRHPDDRVVLALE